MVFLGCSPEIAQNIILGTAQASNKFLGRIFGENPSGSTLLSVLNSLMKSTLSILTETMDLLSKQ